MYAGVRERVYLFHHKRGYVLPVIQATSVPANVVQRQRNANRRSGKTVNGEDILFAMTSLGFENYSEALKIYLSKYREVSSV